MSTANESRNSAMTSEAYDLLDCFVSGLDDLIYEFAEAVAIENKHITESGTVEIDRNDVRQAADYVFQAIREQAGKSVSKSMAKQVDEMHECVLLKCKAHSMGK